MPNVPSEETAANCVNDLFFDNTKIENLTKEDVCDLLSALAKNSLYHQIDGEAMGSR